MHMRDLLSNNLILCVVQGNSQSQNEIMIVPILFRDIFYTILMSSCSTLGCDRDNGCCQVRNGVSFCLVESQCKRDPLWQAIVIPAVLFVFAVILIAIVWYKLKNASTRTMRVHNFAKKQIRMEPKLSNGKLQTLTSIY